MRTARVARNLTLEGVAAQAKLKLHLLEDLERNDLTRWPSERFYREHLLRGYAAVIGLDPQRVVNQFRVEYPEYQPPIVVQPPTRSAQIWRPAAAACAVLLVGGFAAAVPVFESATLRPEAVNAASTNVSEVAALPTNGQRVLRRSRGATAINSSVGGGCANPGPRGDGRRARNCVHARWGARHRQRDRAGQHAGTRAIPPARHLHDQGNRGGLFHRRAPDDSHFRTTASERDGFSERGPDSQPGFLADSHLRDRAPEKPLERLLTSAHLPVVHQVD